MNWMHEMGWWGMGWMWIFWILVLVGLVFLIRWLVLSSTSGNRSKDTPEEILKRRYARGEITQEEYQRMLKDLR